MYLISGASLLMPIGFGSKFITILKTNNTSNVTTTAQHSLLQSSVMIFGKFALGESFRMRSVTTIRAMPCPQLSSHTCM